MHHRDMTKNYFFRKFECGLTKQETADLCFKSVRTVFQWDLGGDIPKECKRLMRLYTGRDLSHKEDWQQFRMRKNKLEIPTGELIGPQQILCGHALTQIEAPSDLETSTKLLKIARSIERIKSNLK